MKGFFQRILDIDLTNRTTEVRDLEEGLLRRYMGGKGLATHLLLERNSARVDPFAPDNQLVLALGPATDSAIYGSYRHDLFTKSPLTGFLGESYYGGGFSGKTWKMVRKSQKMRWEFLLRITID